MSAQSRKIFKILAITFGSLFALAARATSDAIKNPATDFFVTIPGNGDFKSILLFAIQKILLPLVGLVSVAFIIIGGFQYITSGGNEEQAEAGKKTLTNAIIGLVVVILSYIIVVVIINALNGKV